MSDASNPAAELSEAERAIVLDPCECGHTLNDHGETGGCWVCNDDGDRECWVTCEALMVERIGRVVAARLAAGGAAGDEGLRARIWAAMEDAMVGRANEPGDWKRGARRIRVAVKRVLEDDAAPAPTEDAGCVPCRVCGGSQNRGWHKHAMGTAAEEPRTEAQIKAEVWCSPGRQSGQPCLAGTRTPTRTIGGLVYSRDDVQIVRKCYPHLSEQQIWDAIEFESLNGRGKAYRKHLQRLMREHRRADRLSRADEEAGS